MYFYFTSFTSFLIWYCSVFRISKLYETFCSWNNLRSGFVIRLCSSPFFSSSLLWVFSRQLLLEKIGKWFFCLQKMGYISTSKCSLAKYTCYGAIIYDTHLYLFFALLSFCQDSKANGSCVNMYCVDMFILIIRIKWFVA